MSCIGFRSESLTKLSGMSSSCSVVSLARSCRYRSSSSPKSPTLKMSTMSSISSKSILEAGASLFSVSSSSIACSSCCVSRDDSYTSSLISSRSVLRTDRKLSLGSRYCNMRGSKESVSNCEKVSISWLRGSFEFFWWLIPLSLLNCRKILFRSLTGSILKEVSSKSFCRIRCFSRRSSYSRLRYSTMSCTLSLLSMRLLSFVPSLS
jgi:hypothetical protein